MIFNTIMCDNHKRIEWYIWEILLSLIWFIPLVLQFRKVGPRRLIELPQIILYQGIKTSYDSEQLTLWVYVPLVS